MPPPSLLILAHAADASARALPARLPPGLEVTVGATAAELAAAAPRADALFYCSGGAAALRELWPSLPRLRWIHSRPAGVDRLLFPELVESGVTLTNSRGVFSRALAEWALAAVLYFAKDLARLRRSQAAGRWDPFEPELLRDRTAAILGLGDIGRACARLLRAAGMRTLGLRRTAGAADPDVDELLPPGRLLDLIARADALIVALPLTPETRGIVGARELAALRRHAVIVNVARGAVVDEDALVQALRAGTLRGAALDVFEQEPLPAGHPFYALEEVLLSPHSADQVAGWREEANAVFLDNLERYRAGRPLLNPVDKRLGY
jgi:phosphoglycerate dehydrogenase-like enzyme